MEAEERPSKMRKLSHDSPGDASKIPEPSIKTSPQVHGNGVRPEDGAGKPVKRPLEDGSNPDPDHAKDELSYDREAEDFLPSPDATAPLASSLTIGEDGQPLSKNQQKKLRKKQEWESKREDRKLIRKEKLVAKRERKREARQQEAVENGLDLSQPLPRPVKKPPAQRAVQLPITFLIDCDFDDLMRDNERISLAAQITRCYSDNKNSMFRAHLTVCSFGGKLRERFDNILTHYTGWRGVRFLDDDFVSAAEQAKVWMLDEQAGGKLAGTFSPLAELDEEVQAKLRDEGEVIYLTSESDYTLTELKPYSTYIIGGLVDKNREKGICYKRACQIGIKTARLPIGEYLEMASRKVLATNHVNEIMLKWLDCGDWGEAFMKVIPKRKGGKLKGGDDGEEAEGGDEEGGVSIEEAPGVIRGDGDGDAEGGLEHGKHGGGVALEFDAAAEEGA